MTADTSRETSLHVELVHWTGTLFPAYAAARICYSKDGYPAVTPLDTEADMGAWLRDRVLARGHWGILEHLTFTFAIRGISRACSHQLVRHRIASYAQQSQRYVDKAGFRFVVPERVRACPEALARYRDVMGTLTENYAALQALLHDADPAANAEAVNEDARFLLPNACETELVMTVNARQLLEMARQRLCSRAQWEIRALFRAIRTLVQVQVPVVFENMGAECAWGPCHEGGCALAAEYKKQPGW